jgi:flagellar basal body-associated protein FliL
MKYITKNNKGSALLLTLIIVMLVGGIGVAFIYWFAAESRHSTQKELHSKEIALGEAGVQRAIRAIKDGDVPGQWTAGIDPATFTVTMDGVPVDVEIEYLGSE